MLSESVLANPIGASSKKDPLPIVLAMENAMAEMLADKTDRRRFHKIAKLCKHAMEIELLFAEARTSSFDGETGDDEEGGYLLNGVMGRRLTVGGGESQDMIREMVTAISPLLDGQIRRTRAEACRETAAALTELCKTREIMISQSLPVGEIDEKIEQLRRELQHGDHVVPALVLRGRETDQARRQADEGVVGEADGAGADGARQAGSQGGQEVVPPGSSRDREDD